ncbi:MAG: HD domain-containing protein [Candidatus Methanoperedens sp.]
MKEYTLNKKLEEIAAKAEDQYIRKKMEKFSKIPKRDFSKDDLKSMLDSYISRYDLALDKFDSTKKANITLPLYTTIELDSRLFYLYSSSYIQRMSYIKQLSFSYMTYPGALHSRLEHSLGVSHLIGEFCKHLQKEDKKLDEDIILSAKIAGLLHDAGHGPCGHSLELMKSYISPKKGMGDYRKLDKLLICDDLDNKESMIRRALDSIEADNKFISQLLCGKEGIDNEFIYLTDLFDSEIDADRLDYLARDSLHAGIQSGINPLFYVNYATICKYTDKNQKVYDRLSLSYKNEAVGHCNKVINARKYMYAEVYERIERVAADEMICHALYYLIEDFNLHKTQEGSTIIRNLLKLTDYELIFLLRVSGNKDIITLIESLINANLHSEICSFQLNSIYPEIDEFANEMLALGYDVKKKMENDFWEIIDGKIRNLLPTPEVQRPGIFIYIPTYLKGAEETEREKRLINDTLICQDGKKSTPISATPDAPRESIDSRTLNLRLFAPSILKKHKEEIKNEFTTFITDFHSRM